MKRYLDLYMWGYQEHFCATYKYLTERSLETLGIKTNIDFWLMGARNPEANDRNDVCICPEKKGLGLDSFNGLLNLIESIGENHELQDTYFGDVASTTDKPEWIRKSSVRRAITKSLESFDSTHFVTSIVGSATLINKFYVVPIIQIKNVVFEEFPQLPEMPIVEERQYGYGARSLIHSTINSVLEEANIELQLPDPGRNFGKHRSPDEIIRKAAENFMRTPALSIEESYSGSELFGAFNRIASLLYEGAEGIGRFILTSQSSTSVNFNLKFSEPVSLRDSRWVRKILQMANTQLSVIADTERIMVWVTWRTLTIPRSKTHSLSNL